ncbi:MAG TPA: hypothetical protein VGG75_15965 [Trebonia sp.]
MEVSDGPRGVLSGYEMSVLNRTLVDHIQQCRIHGVRIPLPLFNFACDLNRWANGGSAPEPRNMLTSPDLPLSGQPVETLTVKETAQAMEVSESYVRRLIRERTLDVRDSPGPYEVYADSVAVWREQHARRMESDRRTA